MIAQELTFLKAEGVFQRIARSLGEHFVMGCGWMKSSGNSRKI